LGICSDSPLRTLPSGGSSIEPGLVLSDLKSSSPGPPGPRGTSRPPADPGSFVPDAGGGPGGIDPGASPG